MPVVVSQSARVYAANGTLAALVDEVPVGGGVQVKTVDGQPVDHVHDLTSVYHARLISPDRSVSDVVHEAATFDDAVQIATRYAERLDEHAEQVAALTADLNA